MKRLTFCIACILTFLLLPLSACGTAEEEEAPWDGKTINDSAFVETYQSENGLIGAPTVVCDLSDKATYEKLATAEQLPASVILHVNAKYNVVDKEGKKIDDFTSVYYKILRRKIIPIIYIPDSSLAETAENLLTDRFRFLDFAVMSDDPAVVLQLRKKLPQARGIVRFGELEDIHDAVKRTNAAYANIAVLKQKDATVENVAYVQARFKTVWVEADSSDTADIYDCIGSGAYGVISADANSVYRTLESYDYATARMPFNVAHRGLPARYNENSVSGTIASAEAGATHVELDGYLTTDKHIVMMHNNTINATTNGTGMIEQFSLQELREFKLNRHEPAEDIPTLEDIIDAMQDSDMVLVFEIKSTNQEIVDVFKKVIEEKQFQKRVVVISFSLEIIAKVRNTFPEIPTAYLGAVTENAFGNGLLQCLKYNTGVDTSLDNVTPELNRMLADRGYIGWYWTYDSVSQMKTAFMKGYTGLTTNVADSFAQNSACKYRWVKGAKNEGLTPERGGEIALEAFTYQGEKVNVTGSVVWVKDMGDKYAVVASYAPKVSGSDIPLLYTQTFYISH